MKIINREYNFQLIYEEFSDFFLFLKTQIFHIHKILKIFSRSI